MKADTAVLYVNLSASQTRKRLKGHGFGVRRVETVGRGQAVIRHTATGRHAKQLVSLFADVATGHTADDLGTPLQNLRNLGPTSATWLREAGILSRTDLESVGPVAAYAMVRRQQPDASLNLLWALVGALSDRDWRELTTEEKSSLREAVDDIS